MREANKNNIKTLLPRGFLLFFFTLQDPRHATSEGASLLMPSNRSQRLRPTDGVRCMQINSL